MIMTMMKIIHYHYYYHDDDRSANTAIKKKESKRSSKPKKTLKNTPQAKKFPKSQNRQRESKQARMTERAGLREIPMRCDGTPSGRAESDVPVAQ